MSRRAPDWEKLAMAVAMACAVAGLIVAGIGFLIVGIAKLA